MNKELEEAMQILSDEEFYYHYSQLEVLKANKTVLEALNNSTSNYVLYDLAREMRQDGSQYWANRLSEVINNKKIE